jgi:hypothetical protein
MAIIIQLPAIGNKSIQQAVAFCRHIEKTDNYILSINNGGANISVPVFQNE